MPSIFPSDFLIPIFTLVLPCRPFRLHLPQLFVQPHGSIDIIQLVVLSVQEGLDEPVEVWVLLLRWVGCLYLGKVRLVYRSVPFTEWRVDNVVTQRK